MNIKQLSNPVKALAIGVLLAIAVFIGGQFRALTARKQLKALETQCSEEASHEKIPAGFEMDCTAASLRSDTNLVGTQSEIKKRDRQIQTITNENAFFGGLIFALFSVPWLWYFLLARIKEFREAAIGR